MDGESKEATNRNGVQICTGASEGKGVKSPL